MNPRSGLLTLLLLAGCSTSPDGQADDPQGQLALWTASRPAEYSYTHSRGCFCPRTYTGPFLVEARGDAVTRVRRVEGEDTVEVTENLQSHSILSIFESVKTHLEKDNYQERVEYHPTYGHPVEAYFDGSAGVADDEFSVHVKDFRKR